MMKHFLYSLQCASKGIRYAFATERNIRIHLFIFVMALIAALGLGIPRHDFVLLLLISALLFSLELTNTAIERLADKVSPQYDKQVGVVKDVMAGAVLVASLFSVGIGCAIFYQPLLNVLAR